ncbi:MAG: ACP S-malonyltransferase [Clostridiales bacterium]|nr:ACP S-malonyltransferase [Clostridiales bacterium]
MGKIAFVFSGQGAQHPGMAKDFYEQNKTVQSLFDQAEAIRPGTLSTMFEGDAAALCATENTQPCLYLADLAPAIVLSEAGIHPAGAAGFSLGELPALAFAGAVNLIDGFSLTAKRGQFMGEATKETETAMAAVVKLDNETVEKICAEFSAVYPVNYNAPGQLSVAGDAEQMKLFSDRIKAQGGLAIPLKVAGGFHSPFMDTAAAKFADVLAKTPFAAPSISVYANRTANLYQAPIADTLREQMNHPVLWERTIRQMANDGFDTFIETGVGNVLTKLIAKIVPECRVFTAQSIEDCANIAEEVALHA